MTIPPRYKQATPTRHPDAIPTRKRFPFDPKLPEEMRTRFHQYVTSAHARNHAWELSTDDFIALWQQPCAYCGEKIKTIGIDRVNSKKAYHPDNVVPCCPTCNMMKLCHTPEAFIAHCQKIVSYNG